MTTAHALVVAKVQRKVRNAVAQLAAAGSSLDRPESRQLLRLINIRARHPGTRRAAFPQRHRSKANNLCARIRLDPPKSLRPAPTFLGSSLACPATQSGLPQLRCERSGNSGLGQPLVRRRIAAFAGFRECIGCRCEVISVYHEDDTGPSILRGQPARLARAG